MTRTLILALALVFGAAAATAQLYKYTDPKTGKTVYTDQPPTGQDAKTVNIKGGNGPATKSAVEQDKALDKSRKASTDSAKKSADAEKVAAQNERNCAAARSNYQVYSDGGRIMKQNERGERELMSDEEIEAKRESSRREMEEACKQP